MQAPTVYDRPYTLIQTHLADVQTLICEQLESQSQLVNSTLEHTRSNFGKMLRPGLVLLAGKCCGQITPAHIQLGAIVELIHITTLLHDDVLDESELRRGQATLNKTFGNEVAVLAGDYVFSKVFALCSELDQRSYAKLLASFTTRICEGELEQTRCRNNWNLSQDQYFQIIGKKSASLISISCWLGALAAGATELQAHALADFGHNIGIAFQITDDVLDYIGSQESMGKPRGNDLQRATVTLPIIHLLSNCKTADRPAIEEMLQSPSNSKEISALLESQGSINFAKTLAHKYYQQAISALDHISPNQAKTAICDAAKACIDRCA